LLANACRVTIPRAVKQREAGKTAAEHKSAMVVGPWDSVGVGRDVTFFVVTV